MIKKERDKIPFPFLLIKNRNRKRKCARGQPFFMKENEHNISFFFSFLIKERTIRTSFNFILYFLKKIIKNKEKKKSGLLSKFSLDGS